MRARHASAIAVVALAIAAGAPRAQPTPTVTVGRNVHVSAAHARYPMREVTIAADPKEPRRLLGCAIVEAPAESRWWTVVYLSVDGGNSWSPTLETTGWETTIDPSCTLGPDGTAHHTAITRRDARGDVLAVWRSADGGRSWQEQPPIPTTRHRFDQESIVVDVGGGRFHGRVYITAGTTVGATDGSLFEGMGVWFSTDGGRTFRGPAIRLMRDTHGPLGIANSVVTSDGTLVMLFGELKKIERSKPGEPNAFLTALASADGGESLTRGVKVDDEYVAWPSTLGSVTPRLAVDPSGGPFKDRVYATWSDERSGRFQIYVSSSSDKGRTWSAPVVINDDPPVGRHGPNHFMPTVAVNRNGVVGVTWYDRRDHLDNMGWHVRFRASLDGGATWLPSVRVSTASHDIADSTLLYTQSYATGGGTGGFGRREPPRAGPISAVIGVEGYNFNAGDYAGLAADADGVFHALWIDNRTGLPQVCTAPITVRSVPANRTPAQPARANVGVPRGAREPGPSGELTDVSSKVTLLLTNSSFDRATNTVSVVARLGNVSGDTLAGPIQGRVTELASQLARRIELIAGAASGTGNGALIDFADVVQGGVLGPGQQSEPKRLVFRLSDLRPLREGDEYRLDLVSMKLSIHARRKAAAP